MKPSKRRDAGTTDISPAPGRTPIRLTSGLTAVILRPIPELDFEAIGLFDGEELIELIDEPEDVSRWKRTLLRGQPTTQTV